MCGLSRVASGGGFSVSVVCMLFTVVVPHFGARALDAWASVAAHGL